MQVVERLQKKMTHLSDPMCPVPSLPPFLLLPSVLFSEGAVILALVSVKADLDLVMLLPAHFPST